jgi:hypothetical protein
MPYCVKCHRPMKQASPDGYGPVCRRTVKAIQAVERDLFGFDVPAACAAASERVRVHVEGLAVDAVMALRHSFAAARRRLGVWA